MTEVAALIAQCQEEADEGQYPEEAARYTHLAAWLTRQDNLPLAPAGWPCPLCDAEPGQPCGLSPGRFHYGRGFSIGCTHPGDPIGERLASDANPAPRCTPTVELGPAGACRGRCLGCGWRGAIRRDESPATEDANDHAWPGWRDLPVVPRPPDRSQTYQYRARLETWTAAVGPLFPAGWLEAGGPIRTRREPMATRHVPDGSPFGGYDMAVVAREPGQLDLEIDPDLAVRARRRGPATRPAPAARHAGQEPLFALDAGE